MAKVKAEQLVDATAYGSLQVITELCGSPQASLYIDHGVGPMQTTALLCAAQSGRLDALNVLLDSHCEVDRCDAIGRSALMFCAANGERHLFTPLLERGASLSLKADNGWTSLDFACAYGHYEAAGQLLEYAVNRGDDVTMAVQNALGLARAHRQPEAVAMLEVLLEQPGFEVEPALLRAAEVWRSGGMTPRAEMTIDEPIRETKRGLGITPRTVELI